MITLLFIIIRRYYYHFLFGELRLKLILSGQRLVAFIHQLWFSLGLFVYAYLLSFFVEKYWSFFNIMIFLN